MQTFMKYYKLDVLFLTVAVFLGGLIGWYQGGTIGAILSSALTVAILSILETSLSFDNAVMNATVLRNLNEKSRRWFMTWGILVAVLGMRLLVPVLIVSIVQLISPWHAFGMALTDPKMYSEALAKSSIYVSAFGGAFLLMVAFSFFLDVEKDEHWLTVIEKPLAKWFGPVKYLTTVLVLLAVSFLAPASDKLAYFGSAVSGVALYGAIELIKGALENKTESKLSTGLTAGIASLIYLEILDASMSFDGVIGAFAVTTQIFIVMLGLGVGASFVRSMTIQLVDTNKLSEFRFLEHGAQWAILTLSFLMFFKMNHDVPEIVSGLSGAIFIASAVIHSHVLNKKESKA